MNKSKFDVQVIVNDKTIREYSHQGNIYCEGKEGSNYSIKIKNNSPDRIMAVISVDGLSVLTGKKCSASDDIGYILNGHSAYTIDGFRISDNQVAAFKFSKKDKSYLKNTTEDSNGVGIIGVAIWEEKENFSIEKLKKEIEELKKNNNPKEHHYHHYDNWPSKPYWGYYRPYEFYCSSATTAGQGTLQGNSLNSSLSSINNNCGGAELRASYSSQGIEPETVTDFDLGTEWGDTVNSKITTTEFQKGNLIETFEIYYASREMLIIMGIDLDNKPKINIPQAFPRDSIYCQPPSGWKNK